MKQLLSILFLFSTYSVSSQDLSRFIYPETFENPKSSISKNNIASETIFEYNSLKENLDSSLAQLMFYDEEGNILVKQSWSNGKFLRKERFIYNEDKKLHQILKDFYTLRDSCIYEYAYDSLGNEVREYIYNYDTTDLVTYAKVYNSNKQIIGYYSAEDTSSFKLEKSYSYDNDGNLTKIALFNSEEKLIGEYTYVMGPNKTYKAAYYQDSKRYIPKTEYIFDDANNCIKVNGYVVSPGARLRKPTEIPRESDIIRLTKNAIPKVEELVYNSDGTLSLMTERVAGKITKVRRHFYTQH